MIPRRYRVLLWAVPVLVLQLVMIAAIDLDGGPNIHFVNIGFFFGSLFGHVTLSAAWTALGPGPIAWRVPLSLVWIGMLPVAIAINFGVHTGPNDGALLIGACLLGQWLVVQPPLWALAAGYGLRVRHEDDWEKMRDPRARQFSIRQLLIVTTIVAVIFGAGRISVGWMGDTFVDPEAPIFIFLAVAAVFLTLPLLLAGLLPRRAVSLVCVVLALIGLATAWEVTLLQMLPGGGQPGPKAGHFVAINAFTAMTILGGVLILRLNGYGTMNPQRTMG